MLAACNESTGYISCYAMALVMFLTSVALGNTLSVAVVFNTLALLQTFKLISVDLFSKGNS